MIKKRNLQNKLLLSNLRSPLEVLTFKFNLLDQEDAPEVINGVLKLIRYGSRIVIRGIELVMGVRVHTDEVCIFLYGYQLFELKNFIAPLFNDYLMKVRGTNGYIKLSIFKNKSPIPEYIIFAHYFLSNYYSFRSKV
jgi:hypothetical protein